MEELHHRLPDGKLVALENNLRIPPKPSGEPLKLFRAFYKKHLEAATVTSDDFRNQGLDKYLRHRNSIGFIFACWKKWKLIEPTGRISSTFRSTHFRSISQYSFTDKGRELAK